MKKTLLLIFVVIAAISLQGSVFAASGSATSGLLTGNPVTISSVPVIEGGLFLDKDTSSSATASDETLQHAVYPEQIDGYFWRDPQYQNRLAEHSENHFTGQALQTYASANVNIWVYNARGLVNVVAIVIGDQYILVGTGGSDAGATAARAALASAIAGFDTLTLNAIMIPDDDPRTIMGGLVWTNGDTGIPVYIHPNWTVVKNLRSQVTAANHSRTLSMEGNGVAWGPDGFLGAGTIFQGEDSPAEETIKPNAVISATSTTSINVNGVSIFLLPQGIESSFLIYLPAQKQIIAGQPFGNYLPNVAPLNFAALSTYKTIMAMNTMLALNATNLMYLSGYPVIGSANVTAVLQGQRDALSYIHLETVSRLNAGEDADTIAATLELPEDLRDMAWNQPFASSVASIVQSVCTSYLGAFAGQATSLTALAANQRAAFLLDLIGSESQALAKARAYQTANDEAHVQMALEISDALMQVNPTEEARQLYIICLKKLAYMQTSAQVRNYYLAEVAAAEALAVNPGDTIAPTSVSDLAASSITATSLTLGWTAATDNVAVTGYDIYYGSRLLASTGGETSFDVTGLTEYTPYQFMVQARDAAGNLSAAGNVLTVRTCDVTAPVITLNGSNPVTIRTRTSYIDAGATALDAVDGMVPVTTDASAVNPCVEGTYTVQYTAVDQSGNVARATRTVIVGDHVPPVITLKGDNPLTVVLGSRYIDAGATALDAVDGVVKVVINDKKVNTARVGQFTVVYTAKDKSGNVATATRVVHVVAG